MSKIKLFDFFAGDLLENALEVFDGEETIIIYI